MAVLPHLQIPFRLSPSGSAAVFEQDTVEEIAQSVGVLMNTRLGERVEVPDYGIPEQPFLTEEQVRTATLATTIERWEPRAEIDVFSSPDPFDDLRRNMEVVVKVSDEVRVGGELVAQPPIPLEVDDEGEVIAPPAPVPPLSIGPNATWDSLGVVTWDSVGNLTWDQS